MHPHPILPDVIGGDFAAGRHAIGIDVGGTKIAGAIVNLTTGAIAGHKRVATDYERGGTPVLDDVASMAQDLLADAERMGLSPEALGVGVAELVDPAGRVFSDYRIRWKGVDVQDRLSPILPTTVTCDVRSAALAEARYGAGRGIADLIYVTIGTGISAVLVQHGVPYAGARGAALVIATAKIHQHCPVCGHVAMSSVEDIASGPGLVDAMRGVTQAEQVLSAASAGDPRAVHIIDHATMELGRVLALLVNSLDPAAVILGGGLGSAPGPYYQGLCRSIKTGLWDCDVRVVPVIQGALGPDAGLVGAAAATTHQQPESANRPFSVNAYQHKGVTR